MRVLSSVVCLIGGVIALSGTTPRKIWKLTAPTYYIAARVRYDGDPDELRIRGASNLPRGSRLTINILDFLGEGSTILGKNETTSVGKDGFFEVVIKPSKGFAFRPNIVCYIGFSPEYPAQPASVIQVVGKRGEHLGSPKNPQWGVQNDNHCSLHDVVHVE